MHIVLISIARMRRALSSKRIALPKGLTREQKRQFIINSAKAE